MDLSTLRDAVRRAQRMDTLFIATATPHGCPHVAAIGRLEVEDDNRISVTEWLGARTVGNLTQNPRISIVAWDSGAQCGRQFRGEVESSEETAMLDGVPAPEELASDVPQVQRRLVIRVQEVLPIGGGTASPRGTAKLQR